MKRRSFVLQGLSSIAFSLVAPEDMFGRPPSPGTKPLEAHAVAKLRKEIQGAVYLPGNPEYEKLRRGFAAKIDLHPAFVVHVVTSDDVHKSIAFAQTHELPLAVRCGGHSYAGYNTCEGGLVIDLSGLRDLTVSSDGSTVRIGGGVLSGAVEQATAKVGCAAVLGQCPSVGIGGFLLGGGVGPLMSKYGLGCDNILSADIVLADGRSVIASPHHNPDLFWAIRGGGGNFGVVTAFTVALHPVSQVLGGYLTYVSGDASELLRILRDFAAMATDDLTLIATLVPAKERKFMLSVEACYAGEIGAGEKLMAPFRRSRLLVSDTVKPLPYLDLESQVPAEIPPVHWENRGGFFPELNDGVIEVLSEAIATGPGLYDELSFIHLHGAVTRVPVHATAFPLRTEGFAYGIASSWDLSTGPNRSTGWVARTEAKLAPFGHGAYVNVMDREDEASVRKAYADNYQRLAIVKARYDPSNLFSINQNIKPTT
jgi:FAD/FMN-containing dehydrogenase